MTWQQCFEELIVHMPHPSWGIAHSRRVYTTALYLAEQQRWAVDMEALLAASYLHDLGALGPYRQPGSDHAARSAELAAGLLPEAGFPAERTGLVLAIIRGHMYSAPPSDVPEVLCFRDADTLDFLGAIGIARMVAVVGLDDWTPDLASAITLITRFAQELPGKLVTPAAQRLGQTRRAEAEGFLAALQDETQNLAML
jgi:uncharacterized protein